MSSKESSRILVDSYIWMEIIRGTEKGMRAKEFLRNKDFITTTISISEVMRAILRTGATDEIDLVEKVMEGCESVEITKDIAKKAAEISIKSKLGLADALIAASAVVHNCALYTGDKDFKKTKLNVTFLD